MCVFGLVPKAQAFSCLICDKSSLVTCPKMFIISNLLFMKPFDIIRSTTALKVSFHNSKRLLKIFVKNLGL